MRVKLAIVIVILSAAHAFAAMTDKTPTEKIKGLCDVWINAQDNPPKLAAMTPDAVKDLVHQATYMDRCQAFINGVSNEMIGELSWLDDTHKRVLVGNWEDGVTVKQEIMIFLDYVSQNPALMNKPAVATFRKSVEAAGIYTYTAP